MTEEQRKSAPVKVIRAFYDAAATAVIALAAVIAVLWVAGIRPYAVVSGSMEPAVHVGSICVVNRHASFDKVKPGDIIAFRAGSDTLVTHRAVAVTSEGIVTKGDANNVEDMTPVTKKSFVGKTVFSIPKAGRIITFVHTRHGLITSAAVLAAFILLGAAIPDRKKKEKK